MQFRLLVLIFALLAPAALAMPLPAMRHDNAVDAFFVRGGGSVRVQPFVERQDRADDDVDTLVKRESNYFGPGGANPFIKTEPEDSDAPQPLKRARECFFGPCGATPFAKHLQEGRGTPASVKREPCPLGGGCPKPFIKEEPDGE